MTDRELAAVFWATFAVVVATVVLSKLWRLIATGLDEQRGGCAEIEDDDPDPDVDPEAEARAIEEALARDWNKVMADCPFPEPSLTAPRAADSPSAADLIHGPTVRAF